MTIKNFDQTLKEADGTEILEPKLSGKVNQNGSPIFETKDGEVMLEPISFGRIIGNILKSGTKDENLSADEYIARWDLMKKIAKGGDIELSSDGKQLSIIRDLLVKSKLSPFITGQICSYLNEKEETTNANS